MTTVSGIGINAANSYVDADTNSSITLSGVTIENVYGDVEIASKTDGMIASDLQLSVTALYSGSGGGSYSTLTPTNTVDIGDGSVIRGKNVMINSGLSASGVKNLLDVFANVDMTTLGFVGITVPILEAKLNEDNSVKLSDTSTIESSRNTYLAAENAPGGRDRVNVSGLALNITFPPYGFDIANEAVVTNKSSSNVSISDAATVTAGRVNQTFYRIGSINLDEYGDADMVSLDESELTALNLPATVDYERQYLTFDKMLFPVGAATVIQYDSDVSSGGGVSNYYYQLSDSYLTSIAGDEIEVDLLTEDFTDTSRWESYSSDPSIDDEDLSVYTSGITSALANDLDKQFYVLKPTDAAMPTTSYRNYGIQIIDALDEVNSWLANHSGNDEAVARYESQKAYLEGLLDDLGLGETEDGVTLYPASLDLIQFIVPDLYAAPGTIFISAASQSTTDFTSLVSSGVLNPRAGAQIDVGNDSPFTMSVSQIELDTSERIAIDEDGNYTLLSPGNVYLNEAPVSTGSDGVSSDYSSTTTDVDLTYGDVVSHTTAGITDNYVFVGAAARYGYDLTSADYSDSNWVPYGDSIITVRQDATTDFDGYGVTFTADVELSASIQELNLTEDITNKNGDVRISNYEGGIVSSADISGANVEIYSAGDFSLASEGWFHTNQDPQQYITTAEYTDLYEAVRSDDDQLLAYTDEDGIGPGDDYDLSAAINQDSASIIAGGDIAISAVYININGLVQSGTSQYSITIDEDFTAPSKTTALSSLANVTFGDVPVDGYYDSATGRIVIEEISPDGGNITLTGKLLSTGNGELKVADGYATVSITNNSTLDLEIGEIDVSVERDSSITLIEPLDEAEEVGGESATLKKTVFDYSSESVSQEIFYGVVDATSDLNSDGNISSIEYVYDSSNSISGNTSEFEIQDEYYYTWTEGQESTQTTVSYKKKKSFQVIGSWNQNVKNANWDWQDVNYTDDTPLLESESREVISGSSDVYSIAYEQKDDTDVSVNDATIVKDINEGQYYRYVGTASDYVIPFIDSTGDWQTSDADWQVVTGFSFNESDTDANQYLSDYEAYSFKRKKWRTGGGFLKKKIYHIKQTTIQGLTDYFTHSLKADYPVAINFDYTASADAGITIDSEHDVYVNGSQHVSSDGYWRGTVVNSRLEMVDDAAVFAGQVSLSVG
ncbi:hypothetical protein N9B39_02885, partial [bacterium]|nr:hypothetical protein [bacterium]